MEESNPTYPYLIEYVPRGKDPETLLEPYHVEVYASDPDGAIIEFKDERTLTNKEWKERQTARIVRVSRVRESH